MQTGTMTAARMARQSRRQRCGSGWATPLGNFLRLTAMAITGTSIGSAIEPATLQNIASYPVSIAIMAVCVVSVTASSMAVSNLISRWPRPTALLAAVPHGHWHTTTFLCGLRTSGPVAPLVLEGAINGRAFRAYVEQMLAPTRLTSPAPSAAMPAPMTAPMMEWVVDTGAPRAVARFSTWRPSPASCRGRGRRSTMPPRPTC